MWGFILNCKINSDCIYMKQLKNKILVINMRSCDILRGLARYGVHAAACALKKNFPFLFMMDINL